jgi:hypothetical protein
MIETEKAWGLVAKLKLFDVITAEKVESLLKGY